MSHHPLFRSLLERKKARLDWRASRPVFHGFYAAFFARTFAHRAR